MIDIDYFKKINDTYGHLVGDDVLSMFAKIIGSGRRKTDLIGRYGGEEFIMVLPGTCLRDAQSIAENLRSRVESTSIHSVKYNCRLTCSIGVADVLANESKELAIAQADEALYRAKRTGRNRVVVTSID